jgi:hypothetical protein
MPLALAVCAEGAAPSPETERRFFGKVCLPNGTWKTTYPDRLDDVNRKLLDFLPKGRELELMDIAVSSGISTIEWSYQLRAEDVPHRIVAGDIDPDGRLTSWGGWIAVLFDESGQPLLFEVGPLTLSVYSSRRLIRLARPLLIRALRLFARRSRPVPLVSRQLRRRPEIELVRDDVTVPGHFIGSFDAIRAANLVQPSYFDGPTMGGIIENLRDRLREGGLLLLCRTDGDGINRATVFRRHGQHFSAEVSVNGGSEVEDLVLAL